MDKPNYKLSRKGFPYVNLDIGTNQRRQSVNYLKNKSLPPVKIIDIENKGKVTLKRIGINSKDDGAFIDEEEFNKIMSGNLCRRLINIAYLRNSLDKSDILYYFSSNQVVEAFCILTDVNRYESHIKLLCSNEGFGKQLLEKIEMNEPLSEKPKSIISLLAIPQAEGFYCKMGYVQTDNPCDIFAIPGRICMNGDYLYSKDILFTSDELEKNFKSSETMTTYSNTFNKIVTPGFSNTDLKKKFITDCIKYYDSKKELSSKVLEELIKNKTNEPEEFDAYLNNLMALVQVWINDYKEIQKNLPELFERNSNQLQDTDFNKISLFFENKDLKLAEYIYWTIYEQPNEKELTFDDVFKNASKDKIMYNEKLINSIEEFKNIFKKPTRNRVRTIILQNILNQKKSAAFGTHKKRRSYRSRRRKAPLAKPRRRRSQGN
jgi:hypothetical protein